MSKIKLFPQIELERSLVEFEGEEWEPDPDGADVKYYHVEEVGRTGDTWDGGLVEGCYMIFSVDEPSLKYYRAEFRSMSDYYISNSGDSDCLPFEHLKGPVTCTEMRAVPSIAFVPA